MLLGDTYDPEMAIGLRVQYDMYNFVMESGLGWGKLRKDSNDLRMSLQELALSRRRDIINDCVEMPPGTFFDTTFARDNPDYRVSLILLEVGCGRDAMQCTEADQLEEVAARRAKRVAEGG